MIIVTVTRKQTPQVSRKRNDMIELGTPKYKCKCKKIPATNRENTNQICNAKYQINKVRRSTKDSLRGEVIGEAKRRLHPRGVFQQKRGQLWQRVAGRAERLCISLKPFQIRDSQLPHLALGRRHLEVRVRLSLWIPLEVLGST